MSIEYGNVKVDLGPKRPHRERVRIVLDPRGFYKTEPVFEWIAAVDPALGDDYTTLVKWVEGKILEVMTVPKEWL